MFSRILLVVAMSMGVAACVGDVDDDTQGNTNDPFPPNTTDKKAAAKTEYETKVYPIVEGKCGSCHKTTSPAFVGTTKDTSYDAVRGYTNVVGSYTPDAGISNIPVRSAHTGITYTSEERTAINKWLAMEIEAQANPNPGPLPPGKESAGAAAARLMKAFQKCMPTASFNTLQIAQKMANTQSTNGQCKKCHGNGTGGFLASEEAGKLLTHLKNPADDAQIGTYWLVQYFTPQVTTEPRTMIMNTASFQRAANGTGALANHPQFALNGPAFTALTTYLTEVKGKLDADGNCPTPQQ